MLIALIVTELLYDVRDTYFVNDESAMKVCSLKIAIILAIVIVTDLG